MSRTESAEIVGIWIKRAKGGPMDAVAEAELVGGRGIARNANQGGKRQVTVIAEEAWRATEAAVGASVDPRSRRANVMIRGVELANTRGRILRLGGCAIRIMGETRPCELMDRMHDGLRKALDPEWRGGVYGEILEGGVIRIGDAVSIEPGAAAAG